MGEKQTTKKTWKIKMKILFKRLDWKILYFDFKTVNEFIKIEVEVGRKVDAEEKKRLRGFGLEGGMKDSSERDISTCHHPQVQLK